MLFQFERSTFRKTKILASVYDAMFLSSTVLGFGIPLLLSGSLHKIPKAALTSLGMSGAGCYTIASKVHERIRKVDDCAEAAQFKAVKVQLAEEEQVAQLEAAIEGSTRKVELILNKSQPWAWGWWAKRAGVEANMPPLQELTSEAVEQPVPSEPVVVDTNFIEFIEEIPNPAKVLAGDLKNSLIVGVPGAGKGLLISNAIGYVQERKDTTVFYLDPKNDPKESGYFEGRVNHLYRLPKGILKSTPYEVYDWLYKSLTAYEETPCSTPKRLLVIDELTACMKKLAGVPAKVTGTLKGDAWLEEKIGVYVSSGDSFGITVWGVAQNGHNTGVGMDGGAKSQITPIAIISSKQLSASQALQKADFIPGDKKLSSEEIGVICSKSEIGRAIFHGGANKWFPMPTLPNPSGYNRDKCSYNKQQPGGNSINTVVEKPDYKTLDQVMDCMMEWMQSLDELPTPNQVREQWEELSGKPLNDTQLVLILKQLGLEE